MGPWQILVLGTGAYGLLEGARKEARGRCLSHGRRYGRNATVPANGNFLHKDKASATGEGVGAFWSAPVWIES